MQVEINGGVGDTGLSWHEIDEALLAINRGHGHSNRKLARDATVEFALALDDRGDVECEPTGPNEAILFRAVELPAGQTVTIDLLVSGAFTGWSGDRGTFEHWLRPALNWFRSTDLDQVEQETARQWDDFIEPIPDFHFPKPSYAVSLRRSALAAALHADAEWGAIASGFDRGLSAYCWPREAIWVGGTLARLGHAAIDRAVYLWLNRVRHRHRPFLYWFQKYSIDGIPEWETPAVDQSALIPWGLERHYRRTGHIELVSSVWPMVEQAARVCCGAPSGHPGLRMLDDLDLISSAGSGDQLFAAFLYSNAAVVAGLRAAARLAAVLGLEERGGEWSECADRIWNGGILKELVSVRAGRRSGAADPGGEPLPPGPPGLEAPGPLDRRPRLPGGPLRVARYLHAGAGRPVRTAPRVRPPAGADRRVDPAGQRHAQGGPALAGADDLRARPGRIVRAISTRSRASRRSGWSGS